MCFGAQHVNFYRLDERGHHYTMLPHSDIIWSTTEEIVSGEIGNGIVALVVQSISPGDSNSQHTAGQLSNY